MGKKMAVAILEFIQKCVQGLPLNPQEMEEVDRLLRGLDNTMQACWERVKKERPEVASMGMVPFLMREREKQ